MHLREPSLANGSTVVATELYFEFSIGIASQRRLDGCCRGAVESSFSLGAKFLLSFKATIAPKLQRSAILSDCPHHVVGHACRDVCINIEGDLHT